MMIGKLGSAALAVNDPTTVYQVPANRFATVNINVCNNTLETVRVKIAIAAQAVAAAEDWIEFGVDVDPGRVLQRTADVLGAGERVIVEASSLGAVVRVSGFEEESS